MITQSLIAHGFNPRKVYHMLDEYVNMRINEDESMKRYGMKQTAEAQGNFNTALAFMEAINDELKLTTTRSGKLNTGLN